MRKPDFCLGENKGADQLRGNREADQRLCFRYSDSIIPLLLKSEISSFYSSFLSLYRPVCVGPGRKPRRPVFSRRGSNWYNHNYLSSLPSYQDIAFQLYLSVLPWVTFSLGCRSLLCERNAWFDFSNQCHGIFFTSHGFQDVCTFNMIRHICLPFCFKDFLNSSCLP